MKKSQNIEIVEGKITQVDLRMHCKSLVYAVRLKIDYYNISFGGSGLSDKKFNRMAFHIESILKVLEVQSWEELLEKEVRAICRNNTYIIGIGHLTKDQWFSWDSYPSDIIDKIQMDRIKNWQLIQKYSEII